MEELHVEHQGEVLLASYKGEITIDVTPELKKSLGQTLEGGAFDRVVLDLAEVNFIDSSGIGFLVSLASRIENTAKSFYLYRPSQQVARTLELVQLRKYFKILETEEELAPVLQG